MVVAQRFQSPPRGRSSCVATDVGKVPAFLAIMLRRGGTDAEASPEAAIEHPTTRPVVVIADDHPLMRAALRSALAALDPEPVFLEAGDADGVMALVVSRDDIDLVLLDLRMPGVGSVAGVRQLRERTPGTPIAVISGAEEPGVAAALIGMGVAGFIPKSDAPQTIVDAVRLILSGGVYAPPQLLAERGAGQDVPSLTERQLEVVRLLARGQSNKEIARALGITEGTVKVHLLSVFRVLGVRNRTQAVLSAQRFLG
jgi:DNA-binding NarL/FixJ family response regulator